MRRLRPGGIAAAVLVAVLCAVAEMAGAATLPFQPSAKQGLFLQVSDIHFNPFADKALVAKLIAAPVTRWQSIFQSSKHTSFPRRGHADTTYPLFTSVLTAAQDVTGGNGRAVHYDYVLNTGDNLAHEFHAKFLV